MDIQRFDPATDAGSLRACHEIHCAATEVDDPHEPPMSYRAFAAWQMYGWTEDPQQVWLASDSAGDPAGWYLLGLPVRENLGLCYAIPVVHPDRRRAGLGRELVRHAAGQAAQEARTVMTWDTLQDTASEAFSRAVGARQGGVMEARRVLPLTRAVRERWPALRQEADAGSRGYALVTWQGPVPEDMLADVAAVNAAMADAPHDHEAQLWDADRVRRGQMRVLASGQRYYAVGAREESSGELVALTQVSVDPAKPELGLQELTAVARPHRGHRLGLLTKLAMLDWLATQEPRLTRIFTGNASTNKHMIAINEALGYELLDEWTPWEMDVDRALALMA